MTNYEEIYDEIYDLKSKYNKKNENIKKAKVLGLIISIILLCFFIIFLINKNSKLKIDYYKINNKEVNTDFKKYLKEEIKKEKSKEKNQRKKITKIEDETINIGDLVFLKYSIIFENEKEIEKQIKIYSLKKDKNSENYEKIEAENIFNKNIKVDKTNIDKNFLNDHQYYINEEGLNIYLENKIEYKKGEVLFKEKENKKILIKNEKIYECLNEEFKQDYLKEIEKYNNKINEKKKIEKEDQEKNRKELLKGKKYLALTFDDGPGEYTEYFLDKLREKNVKVSFFLVGKKVPGKEKVLKKMYEDGHDIGNHSYNHPQFLLMKKADVIKNVKMADEEIKKALNGFETKYLRPPYGQRRFDAEKEINKKIIIWNNDPEDWKYRSKNKVIKDILAMKENDVAILHDIHKTTVDGVLEVIDKKRKQGFEFVTITELLEKQSEK